MAPSGIGQIITVQAENKKLRFPAVLYAILDPNFNAFLRNIYILLFIVLTAAAEYSVSTSTHTHTHTHTHTYIQGVTGGKDQTSGGRSLC